MTNKEITVWGIHGGKTGDADTLLNKKYYLKISKYFIGLFH